MSEELFLYLDKGPYRFISDNIWKGKPIDHILIATKRLHCLTSFYSMFYRNKEKIVPDNIYDLLTPLVLFHWIMGSSVKLKGRGIIISTNDYNIPYIVKLMNVLIIKYSLHCNLLISNNNTRIYIYRSSLKYLVRTIKSVLISSVINITNERLSYFNNLLDEMSKDDYVASSNYDLII